VNIFDTVVVQPIFNVLLLIYSLIPGGDFGIALIIFTVLVRLAMWPLVKKQLYQAKAMRKLQPELVKIKQRTKGNRQAESVQMMELYKKHDVSPFRSIGILFIQLPIFIALYQVIQIFTLHRTEVVKYTYGFLTNIQAIKDLVASPDHLNMMFFGLVDLTQKAISHNPFTINITLFVLAIIAVITQYIMSKQTMPKQDSERRLRDILKEAADGKEADQGEMNAIVMNKMMKFLPIMMFFVMINLPGALALYYTISNLVAVVQQNSILKKDTEEMIEIADEKAVKQISKKATAKARVKQAKEANITRIVAKDNNPRKKV